MKIKKLIAQLLKCVNQDAEVHIVCGSENPGAGEDDVFDTTKFEVFSDHSDDGYQDLFILDKAVGLDTPEKEITQTNMAGTLTDYIEQASQADLLKLYNWVVGTDYKYDDVDWEN
jgi:hypothetical protein